MTFNIKLCRFHIESLAARNLAQFIKPSFSQIKHVFACVSSDGLLEMMHSHTGCICLAFHHYVFSNVSSNDLPERMQSHIGCICLTFLHCVFSNVSSNCLPERMHSHTGCICLTFLHHVFSNVSSNYLNNRMHSRIGYMCTDVSPQVAYISIFIATLVAALKK